MEEFLIRAAQLILCLSLLIVLHEFGHFIPARIFKTRVEKFYLFFDWKFSIFKRKIGDTEWGIGWLPLGGYVKISGMVDESMDKEQLAQPAQPWEFRSKPAWQRLIIMLGGVTVNIIVGFSLYMMIIGVWGEDKIDGSKLHYGLGVHPYMEQFGFKSGDVIQKIDGVKADNLDKLSTEIMIFGKRTFEVKHADGKIETIKLPEDIDFRMWTNGAEDAFSLRSYLDKVESVDGKIGIAKKMGLKPGDRFVKVNDHELEYFDEFVRDVYTNRNKKVEFTVDRGGKEILLKGTIPADGKIGFTHTRKLTTDTAAIYHVDYSFGESIGAGLSKGWKTLYANVAQFKFVFTQKGASSLGGFGSIGKLFPTSWNWQAFWSLTAFISIALAFMNILPIPALDGGHVMFLLYEVITGRQPAQKVMEVAQYAGFILLIGLILFANGNDVVKALFG